MCFRGERERAASFSRASWCFFFSSFGGNGGRKYKVRLKRDRIARSVAEIFLFFFVGGG